MLDQMQVTTPIDALSTSPTSPYAIGSIDPAQFTPLQAHLSNGEECSLLVPVHLPASILTDQRFKEGYEWGYLDGELEAEWSVPHLVNWTFNTLSEELWDERAWEELGLHLPAWIVGWVLGDLARLAETERTLALVGIAHLCFLLPFLSLLLDSPFWPPCSVRTSPILRRCVPTGHRYVPIANKARALPRHNGWPWQQAHSRRALGSIATYTARLVT